MRVQITKEQFDTVMQFKEAYPKYSNEDIIEIAACPRYILVLYKEAHCLKVVTLNELAMILNGHYDIVEVPCHA